MFGAALLTTAKMWEQPRCLSTVERIKETRCMYRVGYCSAIRKQRDLFTCNDMDDLKGIMPSEIRQTENDKYCTISLMCVI